MTLCGLISGMALASWLNASPRTVWTAFLLLTLLHVVANHRAVRALRFRTFNAGRIAIAVRLWWLAERSRSVSAAVRKEAERLASPAGVSGLERVVTPPWMVCGPQVLLGADPRAWPQPTVARVLAAAAALRASDSPCACVPAHDMTTGPVVTDPLFEALPDTPAAVSVWASAAFPALSVRARERKRHCQFVIVQRLPESAGKGLARPGAAQLRALCTAALLYHSALDGGDLSPERAHSLAAPALAWLAARGWDVTRAQVPDDGWRF